LEAAAVNEEKDREEVVGLPDEVLTVCGDGIGDVEV